MIKKGKLKIKTGLKQIKTNIKILIMPKQSSFEAHGFEQK